MQYTNISAYKFIQLTDLQAWQIKIKRTCENLQLKGTILLTSEGINANLAGVPAQIEKIKDYLTSFNEFSDLWFKHSPSDFLPFDRLRVRIKPEIITFKQQGIEPANYTSHELPAEAFKQWLDQGRDMIILDARNDYEMEYGAFENAVNLNIENFTDFTEAAAEQLADCKDKTIVMYCTGGVRCEKAGPAMENLGFTDIHQLEGGIIAYFEKCGAAHYQGDCFVFDDRIAIDPQLNTADVEDNRGRAKE